MDTTSEQTDTKFGFTWGTDGSNYFLRNPENEFVVVSEDFLTSLKQIASDKSIAELRAETQKRSEELTQKLDSYVSDGYIRPGEDIKAIESPTDISFYGPLVGTALTMVLTGIILFQVVQTLPSFFGTFITLQTIIPIGFLVFVPSLAIHESGHYVVAKQFITPEFDITTRFWIMPTFVVRVNSAYVLPPNMSRTISLAGPVAGLLFVCSVGGTYLLEPTVIPHWVGAATIPAALMNIFPLLPFFKGDGYNIVSDTIGDPNLWKNGISDLKTKTLSYASLYMLWSVSFYACVFAYFGYTAYQLNSLHIWASVVTVIISYKAIQLRQ